MGKIRILDEAVSNIIAAGEVVENPTSMIKELLENSLDAESSRITIEVKSGGRELRISDNGKGMDREDLLLCIERHATSKISRKEDLFNLSSYGFRGEALASICAVSKVRIGTAVKEKMGNSITVSAGKVTSLKEVEREHGTEIEIHELFFNTPARLKFLRKNATEYANIKDVVLQEAMANPAVAITLIIDGKQALKTSGNGIENCITEIFGFNTLKNLVKIDCGYVGNSSLSRSTRDSIFSFVNGRVVKSKVIESAVIDSFYTKLSKGRYPFAIIFIEIDPGDIDVNVHPSKKIVKFSDESEIYERIRRAVEDSAGGTDILTAGEFISPVYIPPVSEEKQSKGDAGSTDALENFLKSEQQIKRNLQPLRGSVNRVLEVENYTPGSIPGKIQSPRLHRETELLEVKEQMEPLERVAENWKKEQKPGNLAEKIERADMEKTRKVSQGERDKEIYFENQREIFEKKVGEIPQENLEKKSEDKNREKIQREGDNEIIKIPTKDAGEENYRIIGQFMDSYILVEKDGELELYDQHIVHERILYEELKQEMLGKKINSQNLLVPKRLRIDPRERELIRKNRDYLKEFGFDIEFFDENELLIRAVPLFDFRDSLENLFYELLEEIKESRGADPRERVIISMSCKGAVKAGEKLSMDEMKALIRRLYEIREFTCPHGRPIIVRLTLDEIEKRFKRK